MNVSDLKPGDRFHYKSRDVNITVLRAAEPAKSMFGVNEQRIWALREDTSEEGAMQFGADSEVEDFGEMLAGAPKSRLEHR